MDFFVVFLQNPYSLNLHKLCSYVTHHAKRDLMEIANSIDPGQPALFAQADHGRNFSLFADFLCIK